MGEKGVVLDIKNGGSTAVVAFTRTEACAKCRACIAGFSSTQMVLEAKNNQNAQIGDTVTVALPEKGFVSASAIMYMFPLALSLAGFLIGAATISDIFGFTLGIALLVAAFLIIHVFEGRLKKLPLFLPYITAVNTAVNTAVSTAVNPPPIPPSQSLSEASEPLK